MKDNNTIAFSIDKERLEYHLKNKRRKIIRLLICLIIWAILIIYLATPLSTYRMMHVKGNVYLSEDEIIELGEIESTWWWLVDSEKLKTKLEEHYNIDNVSVSKGVDGLNISILEKYPLAIKDDKYLMNTTLELVEKESYPMSIDHLIDVSELDSDHLNIFVHQYIHVDLDVRETFSRGEMKDDKIIVLDGKFDENSYFKMYLNLDCLSIKLSRDNFLNIRSEILGKVNSLNVQYSQGNPCIVEYDFKNVYEYKVS